MRCVQTFRQISDVRDAYDYEHGGRVKSDERTGGGTERRRHLALLDVQRAYVALGNTLFRCGRYDGALSAHRRASNAARALRDKALIRDALLNMSIAEYELGDVEDARDNCREVCCRRPIVLCWAYGLALQASDCLERNRYRVTSARCLITICWEPYVHSASENGNCAWAIRRYVCCRSHIVCLNEGLALQASDRVERKSYCVASARCLVKRRPSVYNASDFRLP